MAPKFVVLTSQPPPLVCNLQWGTVLVFDASLTGYRNAVEWLQNHHLESVYRMIIPYAQCANDLGDYETLALGTTVLGKATCFPKDHKFDVEPILDSDETSTWPFRSKNRVIDFRMAIRRLQDKILLRNPFTGLSEMHEFLLSHKDLGASAVVAAASTFFSIPTDRVHLELHTLTIGDKPPWIFGKNVYLPHALLNGPYPISLVNVVHGIKEFINSKSINWDNFKPEAPSCLFTLVNGGWKSVCGVGTHIESLPYGVSREMFIRANPGSNASDCWNPIKFHRTAVNLTSSTIQWDPFFLDAHFPTITSYMEVWLENTLTNLVNERTSIFDLSEKREREQRFLRTIYVGKKIEQINGPMIRVFVDESKAQKRRRIMDEFGGDMDLLQLPIDRIGENIFLDDDIKVPESARDLWLTKLEGLVSGT